MRISVTSAGTDAGIPHLNAFKLDGEVMACNLTTVAVTLEEITDENREAVLALRVAPGQEQFVSSVQDSLAEAAEYPHA